MLFSHNQHKTSHSILEIHLIPRGRSGLHSIIKNWLLEIYEFKILNEYMWLILIILNLKNEFSKNIQLLKFDLIHPNFL